MRDYLEKTFGWKTVVKPQKPLEVPVLMERGEYNDVIFFRHPHDAGRKFSNVPYVIGILANGGNDYEWGYGGTGPTDFAANILMHFTNHDLAVTRAFHIEFRNQFLLNMPKAGGRILKEDIFAFIERMKATCPDQLAAVKADLNQVVRTR